MITCIYALFDPLCDLLIAIIILSLFQKNPMIHECVCGVYRLRAIFVTANESIGSSHPGYPFVLDVKPFQDERFHCVRGETYRTFLK